jgi:transposase
MNTLNEAELTTEIVKLHLEGKSITETAKALNISYKYTYKLFHRAVKDGFFNRG